MRKKVEKKVSDAINQMPSQIIVNGKEYKVAPPTFGTLLMVGSILSNHEQPEDINDNSPVSEILVRATNEQYAPEVLATLILGSKKINEDEYSKLPKWLKWLKNSHKTELAKLTKYYSEEARISEVVVAIVELLNTRMDLGFFSQAGIFLKGAKIAAPTKETEVIAPMH